MPELLIFKITYMMHDIKYWELIELKTLVFVHSCISCIISIVHKFWFDHSLNKKYHFEFHIFPFHFCPSTNVKGVWCYSCWLSSKALWKVGPNVVQHMWSFLQMHYNASSTQWTQSRIKYVLTLKIYAISTTWVIIFFFENCPFGHENSK